MRDIRNLISNLTYSETFAIKWLLDQLIKSSGYKITFKTKEAAISAGVGESSLRYALRELSIAEVIKFEKKEKNSTVSVWVTGRISFHTLVKELGVR